VVLPVFTLIVSGVPHDYSAGEAPSIGEIVTIDEGSAKIRVVRSADGGRVFIGEVVTDRK
jgi:hypothetical protein